MNNKPNQAKPSGKWSLREEMPMTAHWVDRKRAELGVEFVDDCIRRSVKGGEPGLFYAIEGGNVLGTPFPVGSPVAEWQVKAILWGVGFVGFLANPPGVADGTD